jgi:hypothetical protein
MPFDLALKPVSFLDIFVMLSPQSQKVLHVLALDLLRREELHFAERRQARLDAIPRAEPAKVRSTAAHPHLRLVNL